MQTPTTTETADLQRHRDRMRSDRAELMAMVQGRAPMPGHLSTTAAIRLANALDRDMSVCVINDVDNEHDWDHDGDPESNRWCLICGVSDLPVKP